MDFNKDGVNLKLIRDKYCYERPTMRSAMPPAAPAMTVYYSYSLPNGDWGSVGDDYLLLSDIEEWIQGMESVEKGERVSFEKTFFMLHQDYYFFRLYIERVGQSWHLMLSINDGLYKDEYIDVDQCFSDQEWKKYRDEFHSWNEKYDFSLGDEVEILTDKEHDDSYSHDGIVVGIFVPEHCDGKEDISYTVASKWMTYLGLCWARRTYAPNEMMLIHTAR